MHFQLSVGTNKPSNYTAFYKMNFTMTIEQLAE